jgi:hypothetical protein
MAKAILLARCASAQAMIPPCLPRARRVVFSVVQADAVVYGNDLFSYLLKEFPNPERPAHWEGPEAPRSVPFWTDLAAMDFD